MSSRRIVRRTGLDVIRVESRRENVDLVIEFELRGPEATARPGDARHPASPGVRTVSTGE